MQKRQPSRRCVVLLVAFVVTICLCFSALKSRGTDVSRFEFFEHALYSGGGFHESHHDGTGGWLTRWFRSPSQAVFLGRPRTQPSRQSRCAVYTYFDTTKNHRRSDQSAILLAWKRSFWALGFNPIVLTDKDTKKHPNYNSFRSRGLVGDQKPSNFAKWLVMAQHGGLFVDYHSIPMPLSHENHFEELLQCNFGRLTAYQNTGEFIIHGKSQDFEKVVQALSNSDEMDRNASALELLPSQFDIQASLDSLATYSEEAVKQLFPTVTSDILPSLINVHLHEHFLRTHSVLAVLDPIESSQHDLFRRRSMSIAEMIARCPSSPLSGKCPPNIPQCKPCKPLPVKKFPSLASLPDNAFIFGPVPHPLTLLSYLHDKSKLDPGFIRNTPRDDWLNSVTRDVVERRMGGFQRMQYLLGYVDPHARVTRKAKSLGGYWQTWEEPDWDGLGLALGFRVAITEEATGQDEEKLKFAVISAKERVLLQSTESSRDVVEAWNLAWTELWYYIRALQRRQRSDQLDIRGT